MTLNLPDGKFEAMKKSTFLISIVFVAALVVVGCTPGTNKISSEPNVYLIVIDTLRADRLGVLGNKGNLTPNIDALAKQGVVFKNCFSTSSWTVPSMASIMTGYFAARHGVEHGVVLNDNVASQQRLNSDYLTLAERLKDAGYSTHAIVTNGHLAPEYGFAQGFDDYNLKEWAQGSWVNKTASAKSLSLKGKAPYFLFALYFDPHEPYRHRKWMGIKYPEKYGAKELAELSNEKLWDIMNDKKFPKNPEKLKALMALYDSEVKYTDMLVGKLLKSLGATDNDLIIVVSDHGEAFFEHKNLGHGTTVFLEEVRVPCVIRFPNKKYAGQVIDGKISIVDILPTIFGAIGKQVGEQLDGVDLFDCLLNQVFTERSLFIDLNRPGIKMNSVILRDWKLNLNRRWDRNSLFNIRYDPFEKNDVIGEKPKTAVRLEKQITDKLILGSKHPCPMVRMKNATKEDLEKFKSLGYIN